MPIPGITKKPGNKKEKSSPQIADGIRHSNGPAVVGEQIISRKGIGVNDAGKRKNRGGESPVDGFVELMFDEKNRNRGPDHRGKNKTLIEHNNSPDGISLDKILIADLCQRGTDLFDRPLYQHQPP